MAHLVSLKGFEKLTVKQLKKELEKVDEDLDVVILSDQIDFKSVDDVFEDEVGYDNKDVSKCIRLK